MTNPYRAMCAELIDALDSGIPAARLRMSPLANRARALLDQQPVSPPFKLPEPERPTDQEIARFLADRYRERMDNQKAAQVTDARAVHARWGRLAAAPVPLSERLPGPEDCDAEGRFWAGRSESEDWSADWTLATPEAVAVFCEFSPQTVWLPAHALPTPEAL